MGILRRRVRSSKVVDRQHERDKRRLICLLFLRASRRKASTRQTGQVHCHLFALAFQGRLRGKDLVSRVAGYRCELPQNSGSS